MGDLIITVYPYPFQNTEDQKKGDEICAKVEDGVRITWMEKR